MVPIRRSYAVNYGLCSIGLLVIKLNKVISVSLRSLNRQWRWSRAVTMISVFSLPSRKCLVDHFVEKRIGKNITFTIISVPFFFFFSSLAEAGISSLEQSSTVWKLNKLWLWVWAHTSNCFQNNELNSTLSFFGQYWEMGYSLFFFLYIYVCVCVCQSVSKISFLKDHMKMPCNNIPPWTPLGKSSTSTWGGRELTFEASENVLRKTVQLVLPRPCFELE